MTLGVSHELCDSKQKVASMNWSALSDHSFKDLVEAQPTKEA